MLVQVAWCILCTWHDIVCSDLQVTLDYPGNTRPYVMIPMIVPVNTTGCDTQPTYSNHSLISACDITPYIATSLLVPAEFGVLVCRASPAPNCSSITCAMPGSGDNVTFIVQPCYNPPAVTVHNYVNGSITVKQTFSHFLTFNFSSRNLPLNVSLIQHTDQMSLGFKVRMCPGGSYIADSLRTCQSYCPE